MVVWNNAISEWLTAMGILVAGVIILWLVRWWVSRYLPEPDHSGEGGAAGIAAAILRRTLMPFIVILSAVAGLQVLELPKNLSVWISSIAMAALIIQVTLWANGVVDISLVKLRRRISRENAERETTLRAAGFLAKLLLGALALLLILDNIPGVEITPLLASLGVAGIAVALAVQNILADLFASLSILLDKPFVIGDFIIVDNYLGTVVHIGLKTTRLKSLSGEQLIFSNNDLLKSRLRNYQRMQERRVVFPFGVTYQTPYEKLEQIPITIKQIIEDQDMVRFDRAHFQAYGKFALEFEVVYYVLGADYNLYMDKNQAILLAIFRAFEKAGIGFAYPTQTLYLKDVHTSSGSGSAGGRERKTDEQDSSHYR
jgi:small-conductance mechanosensitive channel